MILKLNSIKAYHPLYKIMIANASLLQEEHCHFLQQAAMPFPTVGCFEHAYSCPGVHLSPCRLWQNHMGAWRPGNKASCPRGNYLYMYLCVYACYLQSDSLLCALCVKFYDSHLICRSW